MCVREIHSLRIHGVIVAHRVYAAWSPKEKQKVLPHTSTHQKQKTKKKREKMNEAVVANRGGVENKGECQIHTLYAVQ